MYCSRCGSRYEASPNFCQACGQPIAAVAPAARAARFESLRPLAIALVIAIGVGIAFDVIVAALDVERISLAYRIIAGGAYPEAEAELSGTVFDAANRLRVFPFLLASILFVVWTHRASRNLEALGSLGQKHSPGWAAGWFFIPLANLVMPYLVVRENWKASDPGRRDGQDWSRGPVPAFLTVWWGLIIVSLLLTVPALVARMDDSATGRLHEGWIGLADTLLEIAIAALFIVLVRRLTARQEEKARAGSGEPGLAPVPA